MFCCALLNRITFSYFLIIQLHSWAPQLRHYCVASTADLKHCRHIGTQLGCMILRFCGLALTSSIQHSSTSAGRLLPARRDALSVAPESPSEPAATRVRLAARLVGADVLPPLPAPPRTTQSHWLRIMSVPPCRSAVCQPLAAMCHRRRNTTSPCVYSRRVTQTPLWTAAVAWRMAHGGHGGPWRQLACGKSVATANWCQAEH